MKTVSMFKLFLFAMAGFACFLVSGCMVGPDYSRPETAAETETNYFYLGKHSEEVNDFLCFEWWKRFEDSR